LLVTINPLTAEVSVVGPFNAGPVKTDGTPATMADIGFDSAGNLYGVGSVGGPQVYSISTVTGQATQVGAGTGLASTTGGGLAISAGGVFYGTPTASRYGTYDSVTGAYTNITNPIKPGGGAYAALEFGEGGILYGLNSASGAGPPAFLVSIDPPTGTVTNLGQSVDALDAIAWIPEPGTLTLLAGPMLLSLLVRGRRRR
jgi:hypothetical protein